jgi:proteasome lid subunit RPN8/RPN11
MHLFDKAQYNQLLREARRIACDDAEICGLLIYTGHHLSFVQVRNISPRAGSFRFSRTDVRRIVAAAKVLKQEVVGTFHSHPASIAKPGAADITLAVDDSLIFIFDCIGREGCLWKIKRGKARELKFRFL